MNRVRQWVATLCLLSPVGFAMATSWDEPWQDEVIRKADSFGLYEIKSVSGRKATVHTVRMLAGTPTPDVFVIDGYYDLKLTSSSGGHDDELGIGLEPGTRAYLWPKHTAKGWQLPTPMAGISAEMPPQQVAATYRASFHQAVQSAAAFERVQTCIFKKLHGGACDVAPLAEDLAAPLKLAPASLSERSSEADQKLFFRQHVALESAYLLKRPLPLATIEPFLKNDFFHQQISAVRALSVSNDPGRDERIVRFVKDDTRIGCARAMAIMLAIEQRNEAVMAKLRSYKPVDPETETILPINIMDPRIGTTFPDTLGKALAELKPKKK